MSGVSARARRFSQHGAALLVVIALIAILAAIATAYLAAASTQSKVAANLAESLRAEAAADGAVILVIWAVENTGSRLGDARFDCSLGEFQMKIAIEDEAAKINVNFAPETELARAIIAAGLDAQAAASIAGRIRRYLAESKTGGDERAAFETFTELSLVEGIDEATLLRLRRVLSVHSRTAAANETAGGGSGGRMIKVLAAAQRGGRIAFVRRAIIEFDDLSGAPRAIREWGRGYPADFASMPPGPPPEADCADFFAGSLDGL